VTVVSSHEFPRFVFSDFPSGLDDQSQRQRKKRKRRLEASGSWKIAPQIDELEIALFGPGIGECTNDQRSRQIPRSDACNRRAYQTANADWKIVSANY